MTDADTHLSHTLVPGCSCPPMSHGALFTVCLSDPVPQKAGGYFQFCYVIMHKHRRQILVLMESVGLGYQSLPWSTVTIHEGAESDLRYLIWDSRQKVTEPFYQTPPSYSFGLSVPSCHLCMPLLPATGIPSASSFLLSKLIIHVSPLL